MKQIICIVKPFKTEYILDALAAIGIHDVLITEVRGYGRQKGHLELYRGTEYAIDFLPKSRLEFVLNDREVQKAVQIITETAVTGRIGDGKILILNCPADHPI